MDVAVLRERIASFLKLPAKVRSHGGVDGWRGLTRPVVRLKPDPTYAQERVPYLRYDKPESERRF